MTNGRRRKVEKEKSVRNHLQSDVGGADGDTVELGRNGKGDQSKS